MRISILDEVTRHNVVLFREIMRRMRRRYAKEAENQLAVSVDCRTGELVFEETKGRPETKEWKVVWLKWDPSHHVPLEAVEKEEAFFTCADFKPEALSRLAATIKILNRVTFAVESEAAFLRALSELEIEEEIEDPLIRKSFFNIDREKAERRLLREPIGSYFFRKGEFAELLERNLTRDSLQPIHCFTLIFSQEGGKVSERIVVLKNHRQWLFYDDDPKLQEVCYLTLQALLATMGLKLKKLLPAV